MNGSPFNPVREIPFDLVILVPVVAWCLALCWLDCRTRRLPNWLTVGGALVALVWRLGYGGVPSFLNGFIAAIGAGAFLLLPFLMRGAGGGDVKMLFAAGALVGCGALLNMLIVTAVTGLVLGVGMLVFGALDGSRLRHFVRCAVDWRYDRVAGAAALPPKDSEQARIPFSIPIAAGLIFVMMTAK